MAKKNFGSNFDDYLAQENLLEDATIVATKRYIAIQIMQKMQEENLSKSKMAQMMNTSRSSLDRLLDPNNTSVTLKTLQGAVEALGGKIAIKIEFHKGAA
jgi:antitoxin HicB